MIFRNICSFRRPASGARRCKTVDNKPSKKKVVDATKIYLPPKSKMATVQTLPITAPPLPDRYAAPAVSSSSRLSAPHPSGHRTLLPVGPAHLNYLRLSLHHGHDFSSFDEYLNAERDAKEKLLAAEGGAEDDLGVGNEEEPPELLALDPKEWKVLLNSLLEEGLSTHLILFDLETRSLCRLGPFEVQIYSDC